MRLKTLEIKGFKSFANETVINFNEDVIGIVGPNGSGKSNVVDAIRWVLGEQKSSELRLDKMNSVIFNGTKKRKAGQFASVTLTFENTKNILPTEYASVAITRILYASGESEYRLNGVTCRLKDITTLFMDTGIGSNSYAIIALGMVDDILNDKQNSRRAMFEQAAGVSKYKQRKNETLNKLASTEEDLNRVEDLLFEIDNNLKMLEKQAKRTQKYFDLKAEYKKMAIDLAVLKLSSFKDEYKKLEKQIEVETDKYRQIDVESIQLEANIEKEKKNNVENEQLLSERQRELNSIVGRIRGTENQKGLSQQRKSFIVQNVQKMTEQIQTLKSRQTQLDEDIDYYRTEINQERRLEQKLEDQLAEAKKHLDDIRNNHGSLKAGLDEYLQKQQVIERDIIELEKQKAISTNQIENLKRDAQRIEDDTKGRREEIQLLTEKLKALETKENVQLTDIQVIERDEEQRLGDLEKANIQLDSLTKQLTETNRKLDQQKNEFKLTKSMVESLEGYPESIRFLSNDKTWKAPLLSDLIYVKEDFRTAIENYLEPYLNYYVVQSLEQAYAAIRLLSNAQKGKANFFVLDAFNDTQFETKGLVNARPAIDLIQADMQYQSLFNYLLFNVLIADSENLNDYAVNTDGTSRDSREGVVYLTKSGAMSRRRFSISGGSVGLFEGKKIGRKKNLELLEKTIADTEGIASGLNKELSQARSNISFLKNNEKKKDLTQLQEVINKTRQEKVFLQTRIDNFSTFIDEADDKKLDANDRVNHLVKSIEDMDSRMVVRKRDAEAIKAQMADADGSFRSVSDLMSQNSQAYNEKNIEFIRQQNKVSTLQGELNFRERQKQESENTIRQNTQTLTQSKEELEHVEDDLARFETDLQEGYKLRREHETHLNAFEQGYFQKKNAINKMEDDLRKYNRQRQDMQLLINNLKDKFSDLKIQITSIGERLQVEFNMSVNDVINEKPKEGLNRDELERKVANQKRQLDTYGEINPMAVEAYNEMKERYDTINTQRNDIVGAKEDLLLTMKEIEETATAQFLEAFNTVRFYFIDVFKSLFHEEDTADLILTDPANPLESGIQIIAKPKGKRPQSIAQLSGGEKTLTATALLLALYLYKPAPFCIFDEVDAPLDDANIEKFNKIIKKFSKDSQFIIVTHNKATMAAVDVIYGVHMPEQGVSQVTAVDFRMLGNMTEFVATAA